MEAADKCVDPRIWHACVSPNFQLPPVNSKVYYFPQGHAEHAQGRGGGGVDFGDQSVPWSIPCRVDSVKLMAAQETDEVYAKIRMTPLKPGEKASDDDLGLGTNAVDEQPKTTSFVKTLTPSDTNIPCSCAIPRHHAETVFPVLDYSTDHPAQTVHAKDVHGATWELRHTYTGSCRKHQLTTGWKAFVERKKLAAGDSLVFMRNEDGGVRVGIRRAKRNASCSSSGGADMRGRGIGRASPEAAAVVEAATLAANGRPFEVIYYPGAGTPEFCVNAATVDAAVQFPWCPGDRIKMTCEAEDSSRTTSYMGKISACCSPDPIRWPDSRWRYLQVKWDLNWEVSFLLQNVKCVSPWLVDLVTNIPQIIPSKRPCFPANVTGLPQFGPPPSVHPPSKRPCLPVNAIAANVSHPQFILPSSNLRPDHNTAPLSQFSTGFNVGNPPATLDNVSSLPTTSKNSSESRKKNPSDEKPQHIMLFGEQISTEPQSNSTNSSVNENLEKPNVSDGSGSAHNEHTDNRTSEEHETLIRNVSESSLETGQCKLFVDSEDVGLSLYLSDFECYEELYTWISDMFRINKSEMMNHVIYEDATGAVKPIGKEPFSVFMKDAKRLMITKPNDIRK